MHDIRAIRADPDAFDAAMARRGLVAGANSVLSSDEHKRVLLTELQTLQARRNALAREIGQAKRAGLDTSKLEAESVLLRSEVETFERDAAEVERELKTVLELLPNYLDPDVPPGRDETDNLVLKNVGTPRNFNYTPLQHF